MEITKVMLLQSTKLDSDAGLQAKINELEQTGHVIRDIKYNAGERHNNFLIIYHLKGRQPFYRQFAKLLQPTSLF